MFVPLQVFSSYSFLKSLISIPEYVQLGQKLQYTTLSLADDGVMHGAMEFYLECQKRGIRPMIGVHFQMDGLIQPNQKLSFIVYAKDKIGYQQLIELTTLYQSTSESVDWQAQLQGKERHLTLFFPDQDAEWSTPLLSHMTETFEDFCQKLSQRFEKFTIAMGISKELLGKCFFEQIEPLFEQYSLLPVAHQVSYYLKMNEAFSWKVLKAIETGETVDPIDAETMGTYYLYEASVIADLFKKHGSVNLLSNLATYESLHHLDLPLHLSLLPKYPHTQGMSSKEFLRKCCFEGLAKLQLDTKQEYRDRLNEELSVIESMGFSDYFLIIWDIMVYAHESGIQMGPGRGSVAGSLVAYVLSITQIDPIRYELLFERFLNKERFTMPDIDLDIPDTKREKILHYVQQQYGEKHVAQIATFGTFAAKQSVRDVGRVFGLSMLELSQWSKAIPNQLKIKLEEAYEQSAPLKELVNRSPRNQLLYQTAKSIEGLPRHLSTHAAGVVICQQLLENYIPLIYRKDQLAITQYSMDYVEKIGLLKMDFLGLKNLTILQNSLEFVKKLYGKEIKSSDIPLNDFQTIELFQKAQTNGVFQFESAGIRQVLKKLGPTNLEDIAAVNALYRPGPMQQIDFFIKRKKGLLPIQYPHDSLAPILEKTYGVMVYQEQVLKVTSKMAGFTLGEADILRRAIGKKDKEVMDKERLHFIEGAIHNGYTQEEAEQVFHYIERFADYGFNRSHSFAYSLLAYQIAYLKVHYPIAYYIALLKTLHHQSSKAQEYLNEAKVAGIKIFPPSVLDSMEEYTVHKEGILTGLSSIKGLRKDVIYHIIQNRAQYGPFKDFIDFGFRLGKRFCKLDTVESLIYSGALDGFHETRNTLIQSTKGLVESVQFHGDNLMLDIQTELLPKIIQHEEFDLLEKLEKEIEVLGYPVSNYPTEKYQEAYLNKELTAFQDIYEKKSVACLGVITQFKRIKTKKGDPMAFATVQDHTGTMEITLFPKEYPKYYQLFEKNRLIYFTGKSSPNRNGGWQVQLQTVRSIEDFETIRSQKQLKCYLKITPELHRASILKTIQSVLEHYPGFTPIYLYLETTKRMIKLAQPSTFSPSKKALYELAQLIGKENIQVK